MCPLRFLLVFFSAVLAGYVAWRSMSVGSSPDIDDDDGVSDESSKMVAKAKPEFNIKRMVKNGFWVFVDMASGRHLWRNLKELKKNDEQNS